MERLIRWLARTLEATEREVILGDLSEAGASDWSAFVQVLGLVARRQIGYWKSWRPWVALAGVLPILLMVVDSVSISSVATVLVLRRSEDYWHIAKAITSGMLLCVQASLSAGYALGRIAPRAAASVLAVSFVVIVALMTRATGGVAFWSAWVVLESLCCILPLLLVVRASLRGWLPGVPSLACVCCLIICGYGLMGNLTPPAILHFAFQWPLLYALWDVYRDRQQI